MAKLLMITGLGGGIDLVSGKRGAFYNTLEEFHRYWERIDIILPRIRNQESGIRVLFGNVHIHISPWPLFFYPWWFLKKGLALYKEQKFNLMTVHDFPPFYNGLGARLLWHKTKVPYVLEVHHIPGYPRAGSVKERVYRWMWTTMAKFETARARAVRVVNQKETPEFLIKAGVPKEKIVYIPSMYIDLDTFKIYPEIEKKYDLVFASRLEKNKGINLLLEAIRIVKLQNPNVKLLIIGRGSQEEKIKLQVTSYKLQDNIFFSGWLETTRDVAVAINSAKVFINPSLNEGGPRVVLEAMACGLPVITTKVGLMHDLILDGENGLFTDWEPAKMAEKILQLSSDASLQSKFLEAGLIIAQQFEKKTMIRSYAENLQLLASLSPFFPILDNKNDEDYDKVIR